MKKRSIMFIVFFAFLIGCLSLNFVNVKAEEIEQPETEETEEEMTFDEFKEKAQNWIAEYTGESIAIKIISWAIDAGVLAALFAVVVKYSKYKHYTTGDLINKFKEEIGGYVKENFGELSKVEIQKITKEIGQLEESIETIMKVLILAQDNSTKGKAVLLEFLGTKTKSEEIKESIEQVGEILNEESKAKEEVLSKVSDDYKEIF